MRYLILLFIFGLLPSCTTTKAKYSSISAYDKNGRAEINSPYYQKELNGLGYASTLGITAASAYASYKTDFTKYMKEDMAQSKFYSNKYVWASVGGLLGLYVATKLNRLIGKNKEYRSVNRSSDAAKSEWLKKHNKNLKLIHGYYSTLNVIKQDAYNYYSIENEIDVNDYFNSFNSEHIQSVVIRSEPKMNRGATFKILSTYKNKELGEEIDQNLEKKYVKSANSYEEFVSSVQFFPRQKLSEEQFGVSKVYSYGNLSNYIKLYDNPRFKKDAFINSFKSPYTKDEVFAALKLFDNKVKLGASDLINTTNKAINNNYMYFLVAANKSKDLRALNNKIKELSWVKAEEVSNTFMREAWEIGINNYEDGNKFLKDLNKVKSSKEYANLNLAEETFNLYNKYMLREIVKTKVKVQNIEIIKQDVASGIETWKKSVFFDALFIMDHSDLQFIVKGSVVNDSKFDLPIQLLSSTLVEAKAKAEFLNFDITSIYGGNNTMGRGMSEVPYYIPTIRKGQSQPFQILNNLGKENSAGGGIFGLQVTRNIEIHTPKITIDFLDLKVSKEVINKQKFWLSLSQNQLATSDIREMFGNKYDPEDYAIKIPSREYYVEKYGSDCGCKVKSVKDEGFILKNGYDTVTFENGMSANIQYSYNKWKVVGWLFDDTYNTYQEMLKDLYSQCVNTYCPR